MSEITSLTVPPPGWYPDRNEANVVRWWDGQQWTDHIKSTAPAATAFEQPVSAAAFGLTEPQASAVPDVHATQAATVAPGWYTDNHDPSLQRWWDGRDWTTHLKSAGGAQAPAAQPYGQQYGQQQYPAQKKARRDIFGGPEVNALATRGMVYSLIALVINPFLMMSIGGMVNGIRSLRRAPQFPVQDARRGHSIAAIVVGAFATLTSIFLLVNAVLIPVMNGLHPVAHVFDREGVESHLVAELSAGHPVGSVSSVSCPADSAMKAGDRFDCTAMLSDGGTLPVHITIEVVNGVYTYGWKANWSEATSPNSNDGSSFEADHAGTGVPYSLDVINQNTAADFLSHYGVAVTKIDCDPGASVARGDFFQCVVSLADGSTAGIQIAMSNGLDGGYNLLVLYPPAGGSAGQPTAPTPDGSTDPDVSHS